MTAFLNFLRQRLETGGFTTEDALASFLPLVRQTVAAHASGQVAPLDGLDALQVEGVKIWFEEARLAPPRSNRARLRELERPDRRSVEVVSEARVTADVGGGGQVEDFAVGRRDDPIARPVYLPGYVSWEHLIDHQDPLTDVFSLGLILASLACGIDFTEDDDLREFVGSRRNLFALNQGLHPVLARAVVRMTELNRHRRPQDLQALLHYLENYRDQTVDFDIDVSRLQDFERRDLRGKQAVLLSKLQERLFEITRRNRLLHFRPTMQTLNLTHASVPLSFNVESIRPDQILTWTPKLEKQIASGKTLSLDKYLNFKEAVYLPSVLDRIRIDANRDENEFGFAQLRLVACFLRWFNLKETPAEQFHSPLVLLPVALTKKKGVRDTYWLKPLDTHAEINPVVRHQFSTLYAIDLPETIDLETTSLEEFYRLLAARIQSSEPAVTLRKIDRPRIDLIHSKARRRLDQFCRRARLAGRGVRSFLDLDYSYDAVNYHPLGITLFSAKVRPPETELRAIIDARPASRHYALPPPEPPVAEKERDFYHLREGGEDGNAYAWEFDLCSVTLGNFKYRKMSLVRDYAALVDGETTNPAFEATFSLSPRPVEHDDGDGLELEERYHVLACDPTQAAAIGKARRQSSFIIQGPPGTGKSQTITNLIADYIVHGRRVLFVCEKRAAIDVVYLRLKQHGLDRLCSLIHDSQADKKSFVMDLKRTYEGFLDEGNGKPDRHRRRRERVLESIQQELSLLDQFDASMRSEPDVVGDSVRDLLARLVELRDRIPEIAVEDRERIPHYHVWRQHREPIQRFAELLHELQPDGVLARHPLRLVASRVTGQERPVEFVAEHLRAADELLERIADTLNRFNLSRQAAESMHDVESLIRHAHEAEFLARDELLNLADEDHAASTKFAESLKQRNNLAAAVRRKRTATHAWRTKLPPDEVTIALEQARRFEQSWLSILNPGWWRLRSALKRCYDFRSHTVKPSWTQVLEWLGAEHAAVARQTAFETQMQRELGIGDPIGEFAERVEQFRSSVTGLSSSIREVHQHLLARPDGDDVVRKLAALQPVFQQARDELAAFVDGWEKHSLADLRAELANIDDSLDELPDYVHALAELNRLPQEFSAALRRFALDLEQLEAASAARSLDEVYRSDRPLSKFTGDVRDRQARRLEELCDEWQAVNAEVVCEQVRHRFLAHVKVSSLPAAQLTSEQKEFKKLYNRGRREVEHEFGKSMRYKSIRDLVAGNSGLVVKDLKPVWLMSPLSVSDTLPLDTDHFDVVIFDEASQITLEEAVPSLFRATQAIVVGDEMQLPPTDFFSARRSDEEESVSFEEDGETVEYDLESNSFLNHAARNLPSTMLGWHYRSRSESLISFSNWAFYDGRLLTVPEEQLPSPERAALVATSAQDGEQHVDELLDRAVSFHFLEHGVYDKRRNRSEAEYIAHLVRGLLRDGGGKSIGIVAFSEAQQDEIETALARLAQQDPKFGKQLDAEFEREDDGQFMGLLVKNLENIQGDERDVVVMSVCYGHTPDGRMRMNFGPINKSGGEKRLNVAFSRAKHHMALVSSIRHHEITNDYNDGANCLKNYLRYAEACSIGDVETVGRVLGGLSLDGRDDSPAASRRDEVVQQLAQQLQQRGYAVDVAVGQSSFRCDLGVRRDGEHCYRLGILVDTNDYYRQRDLLERDLMKPKLLAAFGWRVAVVLAKDWHHARDTVLKRLEDTIRGEASEVTQ